MAVAVLNDLENSVGVLGAGSLHVFSQAVDFVLFLSRGEGIDDVALRPIRIDVIVLLPFVGFARRVRW